jgi:hypothetical protein
MGRRKEGGGGKERGRKEGKEREEKGRKGKEEGRKKIGREGGKKGRREEEDRKREWCHTRTRGRTVKSRVGSFSWIPWPSVLVSLPPHLFGPPLLHVIQHDISDNLPFTTC